VGKLKKKAREYGTGKNKKQAEQQAARDALLKAGAISE